jgi:hypothetical protein
MTWSCAHGPSPEPASASEVRKLFAAIEIGSERSRVESALGSPLLETPEKVEQGPLEARLLAWYLDPPPLPPEMSPYMPGSIEVVYVRDRVVEKSLSPQLPR